MYTGTSDRPLLLAVALVAHHVVPALTVLFTLAALVLSPWYPVFLKFWALLLFIYLLSAVVATVRLKRWSAQSFRVCLLSSVLFPFIHVFYGLGVLRGLAEKTPRL